MPPTGHRFLTSLPLGRPNTSSICASCASSIRKQCLSQTAPIIEPPVVEPIPQVQTEAHRICAGVMLSRPPQITRDLHPFEKAFYLYQKRLNERLSLPFTRYLWYKKRSSGLADFQRKIKERRTPAHDIGVYDAYGKDAWHDEVLVGALESERDHQLQKLLENEVSRLPEKLVETQEEADALRPKPMPRVTKADEEGDTKSLDRLLQRTLYLLVKSTDDKWQFPTAPINMAEKETLYQAADRILMESAGESMNTWIVGNHPVGHIPMPISKTTGATNEQGHTVKGDMVFFMKGRIMAGRVDLSNAILGYKDYQWLAKEEIQNVVHQRYWSWIRNMLSER